MLGGTGIRQAKKAGAVNLVVKLVGAAKGKLLEKGVAKVTAKIAFTPTGGDLRSKRKKLTLKAALPE